MTTSHVSRGVPELEPYCGSWIIVSRATGKPVLETFERSTAEAVNQHAYEVLTAYQWLVRFNAAVRIAVTPCPAPFHFSPFDDRYNTNLITTADCGWCGEPVVVRS